MASSLSFSIIIIACAIIIIPTCLCVDDNQYIVCGELFECANLPNISYPFWGGSRPEYCGHAEFQLTNCEGHAPRIAIQSRPYRLMEIDYSTRSLTVAREDLLNTTCINYLYSTTLDPTLLFSFSSTNRNVNLYYGCTDISVQKQQQFNCNLNGTYSVNYFMVDPGGMYVVAHNCNHIVVVPVNKSWGQALDSASASMDDLTDALSSGFGLEWTAHDTRCQRCEASGGRCGSNSTSFACYCSDHPYPLTCNTSASPPNQSRSMKLWLKLVIGLSSGGATIVTILFVIICSCRRQKLSVTALSFWKRRKMNNQNVEEFIRNYESFTPKRYNYSDIKKITNMFTNKLGEGGYGGVFKGKLSDGRLVAVKVLREAKGNGEDFINEVSSISRTSHVNIVTLLGFCAKGNKRALVYEFMPNGSLEKFICNDGASDRSCRLDCKTLYQIAIGSARGLEYLHRGCNTRIVHFDIKPENILLDENFCPKISDFGLAKLSKRKESVVSMLGARGTPGYIAPEVFCRNYGKVSHKSDVYSYGMMVLSMVGAKEYNEDESARSSEMYFPDWIYKRLELGEAVNLHQSVMTEEEEETTRKMILASLWCIQTNPSERPSMSRVVEMLEGSLQSLSIPPKPSLFSPPLPTICSFSTSLESSKIELEKSINNEL